jgi:hypothetical protein
MSAMWPDWPGGDDIVEYADPADEYAAIDASVFFAPYNRVHLKTCGTCGETYINATYLSEHQARDHPASKGRPVQERPARPASAPPAPVHPAFRPESAPASVDAAKVRPLRPEAEPERPMRPEPDSTPPARVPRRRGGPRSKPKPR